MNTNKSLTEELEEVLKSKTSKAAKKIAIIKLGIREKEANFLLSMRGTTVSRATKYNASGLTFGVEIECYNVDIRTLLRETTSRNVECSHEGYNHDNKRYFKLVSDCSIRGENGIECVSPILKGASGLSSLKSVCDSLTTVGAQVNRTTGLHIHFDASKMSDSHFIRIFKNYQKLETIIDSFMSLSRRADNNRFSQSLERRNLRGCETKRDVMSILHSRYFKVNAQSYLRYKTIEFRQHGGTTDYTKIYNWINFLRKLIQFSFDSDIENVNSIEEIPFLNNTEKAYFTGRATQLNLFNQ